MLRPDTTPQDFRLSVGWCVLTGRIDKARKILIQLNGKVPGYDVDEELEIMKHRVALEREIAVLHEQNKYVAIFQGVDGVGKILDVLGSHR